MVLRTLDERLLNVGVFSLVVLGGVLLVQAGVGRRALVVGAMLAALVLAAVFFPTFSLQLLNSVLAAAVFLVLLIWAAAYLVRRRPAETARHRPVASLPVPVMPSVEAIAQGLEAEAAAGPPSDAATQAQASPETPRPEAEGGRHE